MVLSREADLERDYHDLINLLNPTHDQLGIYPSRGLLSFIIEDAIERDASDIYFELTNDSYSVKYMLGDQSHEMMRIPKKLYHSVNQEIEILFNVSRRQEKQLTLHQRLRRENKKMEVVPTEIYDNQGEVITLEEHLYDQNFTFNLRKTSLSPKVNYHIEIINSTPRSPN
ncbi:hypothetical protein HQ489_02510 [Candidatus Woesearchaeota archaeon]|nr:hypothetical protein [Candidatus Woesearchaeota archaeon]